MGPIRQTFDLVQAITGSLVSFPATPISLLPESYNSFIKNSAFSRAAFEVKVTGHPLTAFQIKGTKHPNGTMLTLFSVSTDFTSPKGILLNCSGDLTTQAVGSGWFMMDCSPLYSLQFAANALTGTTIELLGHML